VSLLLDGHALVWWLEGSGLSDEATARIADESTLVVVSAATVWELAIKRSIGKLELDIDGSIVETVDAAMFEPLDVTGQHAEHAGGLPDHHRDPFDRLLIAQAQLEGLTIVTRDRAVADYEVDVLPA
jgi:PIN domain nuclease of toxin-antitoxin system